MENLKIGELAKRAEVNPKTIRFYEQIGLLPKAPRTDSGYRLYAPSIADRIQFIKKAQHLGLHLEEIGEILDLTDRGSCPCGHVEALLQKRLKEIDEKLKDLKVLKQRASKALKNPCPPDFEPSGSARCPQIEKVPINFRMPKIKKKGGE